MPLTFGIPTLDELLEIPASREQPANRGAGTSEEVKKKEVDKKEAKKVDTTSMALLGPDGSGKTVLALHVASQYRAFCASKLPEGTALPIIVYVSSDLQFESARTVWDNFKLDEPNSRQIPFQRMPEEIRRREQSILGITLLQLVPGAEGDKSEVAFLLNGRAAASRGDTTVGFLDLARFTAGDDWNFVNSLIVNLEAIDLPTYKDDNGQKWQLSHLVIIDSVAGFETFMGKLDAYGMEQTRRARIAQCMRNADTHVHLVFCVEEPDEGKRLPEEYVTDVVVRLRSRREGGRSLRTVEVEKARARNHAVGEHVFEIRSHRGSSTGAWENPDTPALQNAYVHVFHSLSHRNLLVAADRGPGRPEVPATEKLAAPFGLHYLDRLLERGRPVGDPASNQPVWGLRAGSTAAIIGDTSTGKSVLADKFLAEGFGQLVRDALAIFILAFEPSSLSRGSKEADDARERTGRRLSQSVVECGNETGEKSDPAQNILADLARLWKSGATASEETLKKVASHRFPDSVLVDVGKRRNVLKARGLSAPPELYVQANSRSTCHADHKAFTEYSNKADLTDEEKQKCLIHLFRHPNLRSPAVLLTTADRNVSALVDRCLGYLRQHIDDCLAEYLGSYDRSRHPMVKTALGAIKGVLEEQIIVRRFDIDSVTSAQLFDVVQRNIVEAHYLLHGEYFPPDTNHRFKKGARIRLVIDDVRVLSNLCPSVSSDSAFLPFLVFYLQREGVTALMVHTDDLRPGIRPVDPISQQLHSLLSQIILTWSVPFQGKTRVAITAIPATSRDTNGIVREVEVGWIPREAYGCLDEVVKAELPKVDVTPKFELYSDLEIGKPRLIPLAVYLFAATEACRRYMDEEDLMYRELFAPVESLPGIRDGENGRVLWPVDASQYYSIRDLTHLPWDVHADHTIVDQIDGFWSLDAGTGALASQRDYLMSKESKIHEDPFNLFRGKPLHLRSGDNVAASDKQLYPRSKFFQNSGYRSRIVDFAPSDDLMPDRVPFMWDFGFVLVPVGPWKQAAGRRVKCHFLKDSAPRWHKPLARESSDPLVTTILEELRKEKDKRKVVPWRLFLGACKEVADQSRQDRAINPVGFDFASTSAETVTSLFMEIWFSEITLALLDSKGPGRVVDWNDWLVRLSSNVYQPLGAVAAKKYSLVALLNPSQGEPVKRLGVIFREFRKDYIEKARRWDAGRGLIQQAADSPEQEEKIVAAWEEATIRANDVEDKKTLEQREQCVQGLPVVALSLYKTWLLLLDVFDFASLLDPNSAFEIKQPKVPSRYSMAVRHYYRTACDHQAHITPEGENLPDGQYALAMPGCFSTRGDTFLATAQASRSRLLASHAIDLLCSRRANLRRMQLGMGLPVRDVLREEACRNMRTAVRAVIKDENRFGSGEDDPDPERAQETLMEVTYADLCGLGGEGIDPIDPIDPTKKDVPPLSFPPEAPDEWKAHWLFRNGIPEYDRVSRVFQKWLSRLCQWTVLHQAQHTVGWAGGFAGYDALSEHRFAPLVTYDSFEYFADLCDYLVAELDAAERRTTG